VTVMRDCTKSRAGSSVPGSRNWRRNNERANCAGS
jgi:hypothetical protein